MGPKITFPDGSCLSFNMPLLMGIVNLTPDSFYDGGRYTTLELAIKRCAALLEEGADIIDLGAVSTRPGAAVVSEKEERRRLLPVLKKLKKTFPAAIISIDTFRSSIAKESLLEGASMINDISGGAMDAKMFEVVGNAKAPYILMHSKGTPQNMQVNPVYKDVVAEIKQFFMEGLNKLKKEGAEQVILDPGFGFGKTVEHNYEILARFNEFGSFNRPMMAGISRKSMVNKVLKTKPGNALTGTIALNTVALLKGANLLRVHDVKEAKQVVDLIKMLTLSEK
jgi:dihydropteroate synthase